MHVGRRCVKRVVVTRGRSHDVDRVGGEDPDDTLLGDEHGSVAPVLDRDDRRRRQQDQRDEAPRQWRPSTDASTSALLPQPMIAAPGPHDVPLLPGE
jgi:hypothetical protein